MLIDYRSPIKGKQFDVSKAPDDTFSNYLVGVGFVIDPTDHTIYAPFDGKIVHIFPSNHALTIQHASGINVLIHLGFGTVELAGKGITSFVKCGQIVQQKEILMTFDYQILSSNVSSLFTPVVFIQKEHLKIIKESEVDGFMVMTLDIS